jgi:hypothetical protein
VAGIIVQLPFLFRPVCLPVLARLWRPRYTGKIAHARQLAELIALEQRRVIDEYPRFGLVDLDKPALPDGLRYPVWVKSVTSPTHGARCPPPLPDRATARHARCPAHTSRWMQRHDTGQRPLPRTL